MPVEESKDPPVLKHKRHISPFPQRFIANGGIATRVIYHIVVFHLAA
jgi:hypothetical protein